MEINAGVDIGTDFTQATIAEDDEPVGYGEVRTKFDLNDALDRVLDDALEGTEFQRDDVDTVVATGEGRKSVTADEQVTLYKAIGLGVRGLWPEARTVLLMGAKNAAALDIDEEGNVLDFDENDRCAAGVGRFLSDLTRYVDMDLEEMIEATLEADEAVEELNTQCSVFAESEVISLIHEGVSPARIARGVHEAIAERNSSLLRRVGVEEDVLIVGGVGRNRAFIEALEDAIDTPVHAPERPAHVPAYGAVLSLTADTGAEIEADVEPGEKQEAKFEQEIGD